MAFRPLEVRHPIQTYAAIGVTLPQDAIAEAAAALHAEVYDWLAQRRIPVAGPPLIRYLALDAQTATVHAGFPLAQALAHPDERIEAGELPAGTYVTLIHRGPHTTLATTTAMLLDWAQTHQVQWQRGGTHDAAPWTGRVEHYLVGPPAESDSNHWHTEIAFLRKSQPH